MAIEFDLDFEKVVAAVSYLASRQLPELSKGKICKLLFLADRAHLVRYGRPITGDRHCALVHGPILSRTLNVLNAIESGNLSDPQAATLAKHVSIDRRFTHPHFTASEPFDLEALSRSDVTVLAQIVEQYGHKTFRELRNLTHDFLAYKIAWDGRVGDSANMRFEDLFEDEDADDIVQGVKEEVLENFRLREALSGPV